MRPAVLCIPWRAGVPTRELVWQTIVRPHIEATGYPFATGDSDPSQPFNLSQARNRAAEAAGDADVLIFNDADVVVPKEQLDAAVELASRGGAVYPFESVVWASGPQKGLTDDDTDHYGTIVVPRYLFELVGGYDERFTSWGWEARAFHYMVTLLGGTVATIPGKAIMYDHARTPQERPEWWMAHEFPDIVLRYGDRVTTVAGAYSMADEVRAARKWGSPS